MRHYSLGHLEQQTKCLGLAFHRMEAAHKLAIRQGISDASK